MKERPILFSGAMVRALLADAKTQTRRVVKMESHQQIEQRDDGTNWPWMYDGERDCDSWMACHYGQPGDRLWVRETFRGCRAYEVQGYPPKDWGNKPIWFEADGAPPGRPDQWASRSRPSIHMPRWASRITLEVTGVRLERIQGITPDDCIAEGAWPVEQRELGRGHEAVSAFRELWESTGGDWDANPWVWAIDFKVLSTTGRPA